MQYSKALKVVLGSLAGGSVLLYYHQKINIPQNKLSAFAASPLHKNDYSTTKWDSNWDQRNNEKSHATRNIILIRHGQYHMDGKDKMLTSLGREQAIYTGMRLKSLGLDEKITHFAQSTMTRARETGELIFKQLGNLDVEVEKSDLLREGAPIQPEPPIDQWNPDPKTFFNDGARIETAFRNYVHRAPPEQEKDSYEVVVCHGNVIRYFVCRALQLPPEAWLRLSLRHASITWLCVRPGGRVSLKCLGDSGHIPTDKLSFE